MPRPRNAALPSRELRLTIESLGARGDGIGTGADGTRLFVPFTVPGDEVLVRAPQTAGPSAIGHAAGRGEVSAWLTRGPGRAEPVCPHFGRCGGCALQHVESRAYTAWKRARVAAAVARAGADPALVAALVTTAAGQRRRARLAVRRSGSGIRVGFQQARSHALVDVAACPVLDPGLVALLPIVRRLFGAVLRQPGQAADLLVTRLDAGAHDALLIGPDQLDLQARDALASFADAADLARLSWRRTDHDPIEPVAHRRPVSLSFGRRRVDPPPGAFLQATSEGEDALARFVLAACAEAGRVADLYAGCGSFALRLVESGPSGRSVLAAEGDAESLAALRAAGAPVTTMLRDLARQPLEADLLRGFDAVVLDPPRAGAAAQTAAVANARVPTVVAVSCNPDTWARDARILGQAGYRLQRVVPVDQFLWSRHVEIASAFQAEAPNRGAADR